MNQLAKKSKEGPVCCYNQIGQDTYFMKDFMGELLDPYTFNTTKALAYREIMYEVDLPSTIPKKLITINDRAQTSDMSQFVLRSINADPLKDPTYVV